MNASFSYSETGFSFSFEDFSNAAARFTLDFDVRIEPLQSEPLGEHRRNRGFAASAIANQSDDHAR